MKSREMCRFFLIVLLASFCGGRAKAVSLPAEAMDEDRDSVIVSFHLPALLSGMTKADSDGPETAAQAVTMELERDGTFHVRVGDRSMHQMIAPEPEVVFMTGGAILALVVKKRRPAFKSVQTSL